jgi:cytochrome c peroxidase
MSYRAKNYILKSSIPRYQQIYSLAFPGDPAPINRLNTALAIAAFERTILASEAPFQKWLRGNKTSMTDEQKRGAIIFFGKANCVSCHTGPALNSMTFYALGMNDLDGSCDNRVNPTPFGGTIPEGVRKGRGGFTGHSEDMYKFKTPSLYNLADAPFYGHGSSFCTIYEVVGLPEQRRSAESARSAGVSCAGIRAARAWVRGDYGSCCYP